MIVKTLRENARVLASLPSVPERALEVGALPSRLYVSQHSRGPGGVRVEAGRRPRDAVRRRHGQDLVVCASTPEHIPQFWEAVAELRRVLAPGGTLLVSTPGYRRMRGERVTSMRVHDERDYYRFSPDSYSAVIMAGLEDVRVWSIMTPPRLYATGRKPAASGSSAPGRI